MQLLTRKKTEQVKSLSIAAADESAFRGQRNISMKKLQDLGLLDGVELIFDHNQTRNSVLVY
jgi:hypothetical protein